MSRSAQSSPSSFDAGAAPAAALRPLELAGARTEQHYERVLKAVATFLHANAVGERQNLTAEAALAYLEALGQKVRQETLDLDRLVLQAVLGEDLPAIRSERTGSGLNFVESWRSLVSEVGIDSNLAEALKTSRLPEPRSVRDREIAYRQNYDLGGGKQWSDSFGGAARRELGRSADAHGLRVTMPGRECARCRRMATRTALRSTSWARKWATSSRRSRKPACADRPATHRQETNTRAGHRDLENPSLAIDRLAPEGLSRCDQRAGHAACQLLALDPDPVFRRYGLVLLFVRHQSQSRYTSTWPTPAPIISSSANQIGCGGCQPSMNRRSTSSRLSTLPLRQAVSKADRKSVV